MVLLNYDISSTECKNIRISEHKNIKIFIRSIYLVMRKQINKVKGNKEKTKTWHLPNQSCLLLCLCFGTMLSHTVLLQVTGTFAGVVTLLTGKGFFSSVG